MTIGQDREPDLLRYFRLSVEGLAVATLLFFTLLVLIQVFARYVLNQSIFWSEEIVRYGLIWSVMLGTGLCTYREAHLRIELLELVLGPRGRFVLAILCDLLLLAFAVILCWQGIVLIQRTLMQSTAVAGLPMWVVYSAMPIGAVLEILFLLARWYRRRAGAGQAEVIL
jgi:C4-dicarboxylate transporter, DctQ subunit